MDDLSQRLSEAFRGYTETVALVRQLIANRSNPQEIILLVCARLDSLCHLRASERSDKERFVDFVKTYSCLGEQALQISVPDLFDKLCAWYWALPAILESPGRLQVFDARNDDKLINLVWETDVPITRSSVGQLLVFLIRELKSSYRVVPNQSHHKVMLASRIQIISKLEAAANNARRKSLRKAAKSLNTLLQDFSLGSLLYKNYRCGAIHEHKVAVDHDSFFERSDIHWRNFSRPYDDNPRRMGIQFPAAVLLNLLESSLGRYIAKLEHTRKLPADIFFEFCDPLSDDSDLLDTESLPASVNLRPR